MRSLSRFTIQGYISVCLTVALTLVAATAVPVWSAPAMSQELKMTIMNRISLADDRGKVLQSTARAVENGYPEEGLAPIIEKSLDRRISPDAISRMIDTIDEARGKGLPAQPYAEKIMEGLAKKVKEERILSALEKIGQRMEFASTQAEKVKEEDTASRMLIIRTSDAMSAGMDRKNLVRIYDVMARDRVNRNIKPEELMEMIKAASGYGVDSRSVGDHAISLMKNRKADSEDIRRYLDKLSENGSRHRFGSDSDDSRGDEPDSGDDDGDGDGDHEDDDGNDHEDDDGNDGEDDGDDGGEEEDEEDEEDDEEDDEEH